MIKLAGIDATQSSGWRCPRYYLPYADVRISGMLPRPNTKSERLATWTLSMTEPYIDTWKMKSYIRYNHAINEAQVSG